MTRSDIDACRPALDAIGEPWNRSNAPGCVMAIFADGEIAYQRAVGMADLERAVPLSVHSVFDVASTSKQFVATCIHLLAADGDLDLQADVRDFFPQLTHDGATITVRHLLHHTSGIRDYLTLMHLAGMSFANDYYEEEIIDLIARQKALNFPPGSEFLYSNSGYFLLGEIVRHVAGQSLGTFAKKRIFEPLGMKQTLFYDDFSRIVHNRAIGYAPLDEQGFRKELYLFDLVGDGGLLTCAADLLLWDRNFYANALGGGEALIAALHATVPLSGGGENQYAAGLLIGCYRGLPTVGHGGAWAGYRSEMIRFPAQRVTVLAMANRSDINAGSVALRMADIVLAEALAARPQSAAPPPAGQAVELARYAGSYRSRRAGTVLTVTLDEAAETLIIHHPAGLVFPLVAAGPSHFHTADSAPVSLQATFDQDASGTARLTLQGESQPPAVYLAFTLSDPTPAALEAYIGRYTSEELRATYHLMIEEERLVLTLGYDPQSYLLQPAGDDEFSGRGAMFHFIRGADGKVCGFRIRAGRVDDIAFRRA